MKEKETVQTVETPSPATDGSAVVETPKAPAAADKPLHELPMGEYMKARKDPAKTNAPESAPGKETEETEEQKAAKEAAGKEEQEKKKGGWQRKIDKLTKELGDSNRALETERELRQRAEADRLAGKPAAAEAPKPAAGAPKGLRAEPTAVRMVDGKEVPGAFPDGTPYKTYEDFVRDLTRWEHERIALEEKEAQAKTSQETAEQAIFKAHHGRVEEFRKSNADYDEVMEEMDGEELSFPAGMTIVRRKDSAAILYHLAKNPEVREKLNAIADPLDVAAEVGIIAASLAKASSTAEAPKSPKPQAPPPPKPIEPVSGGQARSAKPLHERSMGEYMKARGMKR